MKMAFLNRPAEAVPDFPDPVLQALRDRPKEYASSPLLLIVAILS
jgi:hypothetical protein